MSLIKVKGQTEGTFRMIAASRQMSAEIQRDIRAIRTVVLRRLERSSVINGATATRLRPSFFAT